MGLRDPGYFQLVAPPFSIPGLQSFHGVVSISNPARADGKTNERFLSERRLSGKVFMSPGWLFHTSV